MEREKQNPMPPKKAEQNMPFKDVNPAEKSQEQKSKQEFQRKIRPEDQPSQAGERHGSTISQR